MARCARLDAVVEALHHRHVGPVDADLGEPVAQARQPVALHRVGGVLLARAGRRARRGARRRAAWSAGRSRGGPAPRRNPGQFTHRRAVVDADARRRPPRHEAGRRRRPAAVAAARPARTGRRRKPSTRRTRRRPPRAPRPTRRYRAFGPDSHQQQPLTRLLARSARPATKSSGRGIAERIVQRFGHHQALPRRPCGCAATARPGPGPAYPSRFAASAHVRAGRPTAGRAGCRRWRSWCARP